MAEPQAWRVRNERADDGAVILGVDFTTTGRADAGFSNLVERVDTHYALWETVAPEPGEEEGFTGGDYLDRWTDSLRQRDVEVAAVFGYCASSVFALALADRVGTWQRRPKVVLFDPTAINGPNVLRYGFYKVVDALASVLSAEEVERARSAGQSATQATGDLVELTREFVRIYRDAGSTAFARLGLREDRVDELVAWFRSYLNYVVAAGQVVVTPDPGAVTVIRSCDLPAGFLQATHELTFDIEHTGLLAHGAVADAVAELLA